jgi:hypothetical protein
VFPQDGTWLGAAIFLISCLCLTKNTPAGIATKSKKTPRKIPSFLNEKEGLEEGELSEPTLITSSEGEKELAA